MVSRACPGCQAHLESQENQVTRVSLEKQGLLVLPVQEEKEAPQEREVKSGPMGCRDPKAVQVHQDQMDQRVMPVHRALLVSQEVQDCRGCQGREAYQDLQARKETQALLERKDLRAKLELTVHGGFLVLLDLLVPVDPTERRVKLVRQDLQDAEAQEELLVLPVTLVQLVPSASLDPPGLMVSLGSKVKQVSQA